MKNATPAFLILLAAWVLPAPAATVSGAVTGNVRWTAAQSPVRVVGEVVVQPGASLAIAPGVEVVFAGAAGDRSQGAPQGCGLTVRGTLRAEGSETELVTFRGEGPPADDPAGWQAGMPYDRLKGWNQFRGITFETGAAAGDEEGRAGCLLKFCRFVGAHSAVVGKDVYVTVSHCHFQRCGAGGDLGTALNIERGRCEYCLVEWSGEAAIHLGADAVAEYCAVRGGFAAGLRGETGAEFTNCLVEAVRGYAVAPVGGEFDLYYSRFEGCGSGFGVTKQQPQARVHFENCDFVNCGDGTTRGAFTIEEGAQALPDTICLDGQENRVLCATALVDRAGGKYLQFPHVWWGGKPVRHNAAVGGAGSSFVVEPALTQDPHLACIEHVGKVHDPAGNPVADALVYTLFSMAPVTITDSEGQYRLEGGMPAMYDLYAFAPGVGLGAQRADWGFAGERLGNVVTLGARNYNPYSEHLKPAAQ